MISDLPRTIADNDRSMPRERFANAGEVNTVCQQLILADNWRSVNRAKVQGLIDGNRPYSNAALTKASQGWRANVNFREGEGMIQAQRTPYYDLIVEVKPCIECVVDYGRDDQAAAWSQVIAEEFHRTMFGWDGFDWHAQLQQSEMLTHGWGTHLYLNTYDWRPTTKQMRNVLFPDGTTSALDDNMEYFVVRENKLAHQLWRYTAPEAIKAGWKKEAVIETIQDLVKGDLRRDNAEQVQARMKNGDIGFSAQCDQAWLNHMLVRECDTGKISHYIIEETGNDYLYVKRNRWKDWSEIVSLFPYDIGSDGTIHSIRGLGARIFPFCELFNRITNQMVDSVMVGSSILLTTNQALDPTKLNLTNIGPMKLLPAGVAPAPWKAMDLGQGPLALKQDLQRGVMENNKVYRQTVSDTNSSTERTAYEVSTNAADSARLQKSAHNMYYRALSRDYRIRLTRLCNPNVTSGMVGFGQAAVEFQNRCMKRGVPKIALQRIITVEATRSLGAGSASARINAAQQLMQTLYPITNDEIARNNMKQDYVASLCGYTKVERYAPSLTSQKVPNSEDSTATLENDALLNGGEALAVADNDHVKHLSIHLGKCGQLLNAIQQGQADPAMVMRAWDAFGPHVAAHLHYLQRDPTRKADFDFFNQQFNSMSSMADKLRQHLEEMAQSQAQAAEAEAGALAAGDEIGLRQAEIQQDGDIRREKIAGDLQLKAEKNRAGMELARAKAAESASLKRQVAAENVRLKEKQIEENKKSLPYKRNGKKNE